MTDPSLSPIEPPDPPAPADEDASAIASHVTDTPDSEPVVDEAPEPEAVRIEPDEGQGTGSLAGRSPGRLRRYVAAFASAIVPGTGHLLYGRWLLAAAFLIPTGSAVVLAAGALSGDRAGMAARLVDPQVLGALLVAEAAVLVWRLLAVGSTLFVARPPRYAVRDILPVALLALFVGIPQGYALAVTDAAREASLEVFSAVDSGPVWRPSTPPTATPMATPLPPGDTPEPATPSPSPTAAPARPRVTVLLIGEDSGVGRNTALTDTMIVASLDPVGRTVSMLSIPRDLVDAPIPGGGVWQQKINSLAAWVRWHPDQFPGSNGSGQAVLAGVISELIGVPIDYWAQVNLGGMLRVVDAVGGVDVTVTHGFCDPRYIEYGQHGFGIPAGRWHLNGSQALAFARVRKAAGESDFTRAARQQEVLAGLRDALIRGGFVNDPIGFLGAIGQTVRTNLPPSLLPELAPFATQIGRDRLYRAVVTYPLISSAMDARGYVLLPDITAIRALAARMFPTPGLLPDPTGAQEGADTGTAGGAGPGTSAAASEGPAATARPAGRAPNPPRVVCTAPAPAPTPKPTAKPTPKPTTQPSAPASSSPSEPLPSPSEPAPSPSEPAPSASAEATAPPSATATSGSGSASPH